MIKNAPLCPAWLFMLNPNGRVVCAAANQCELPEQAEVGGMRVHATPDKRSTFVGIVAFLAEKYSVALDDGRRP